MRELLLVRKLEEENAKKQNTGENTVIISPTKLSPNNNEASLSSKELTLNSDLPDKTTSDDLPDKVQAADEEIQQPGSVSEDLQVSTPPLLEEVNHPLEVENENFTVNTIDQSKNNTIATEFTSTIDEIDKISAPEETSEERREREAHAQALLTRRKSLKEFFIKKQPYIHKDIKTENDADVHSENFQLNAIDESNENLAQDELKPSTEKSNMGSTNSIVSKSQISGDNPLKGENNDNLASEPRVELSSDEKRQRQAADRLTQRKALRELMKHKRRQSGLKPGSEIDIQITVPTSTKKTSPGDDSTKDVTNGQTECLDQDGLGSSTGEGPLSTADMDSDDSLDLDGIISQNSVLEGLDCDINDVVDDDDEDFWKLEKIDTSELAKHLTPSTSPLRQLSPDPQGITTSGSSSFDHPNPGVIKEEEEEEYSDTPLEVDKQEADDLLTSANANYDINSVEEDELDLTLDAQLTPVLKPSSPSPSPSPRASLTGVKTGITPGISRAAFGPHFGASPLSPSSSRASSVADDYETMSNASYTSVRSTNSVKSSASAIRRPSTTTGLRAPNHVSSTSKIAAHNRQLTSPTPTRPRSMSIVSTSSTEESTTSSIGATSPSRIVSPTRGLRMPMHSGFGSGMPSSTRPRSLSRVSSSSTDDTAVKNPPSRALSRASTTSKPSSVTSVSSTRTRNSISGTSTNSKLSGRPSVNSNLARPSSRIGTTKASSTPQRPLNRLSNIDATQKVSALNKKTGASRSGVTTNTGVTSPTGISGIKALRSTKGGSSIAFSGGRHSSESLSSHEEYSAANIIFTPPESPTGASETDSLTSLASSVSYGSSPGRGTSPIPPQTPNSVLATTSSRLTKQVTRNSSISQSGISKLSASRLATSSTTSTRSSSTTSGLRRPKT